MTKVEDVVEEGVVVGYKLTFAKSGEKIIYHGQKGDQGDAGADAVAPQVRINPDNKEWEISTDGGQTWTSTGVVAVGPKGDTGSNGSTGAAGNDGVTPKFKIENGKWFVSYDEEQSWTELGQATGAPGADGNSFFESVSEEKDAEGNVTYIVITVPDNTPDNLDDNTKYRIPTAFTIAKLEAQVAELSGNVTALQALVKGQTFITSVTEKKVDGKVVGIEYESVTVKEDGTFSDPVKQTISFAGLVTPGEDGFKVFTGYDENGSPVYTEMSWAHTPEFKTENGKVWMTINGTDWIEVYEIPEDNNTNYYGKAEEIKNGDVVVGYKIYFPDGNGGFLDPIEVVSKAGYDALVKRVTALESGVTALKGLLNDKTFITSVTPVTENGVVVGFKYGSVSINATGQLTTNAEQTVTLDGLVIPNGNEGFKVITGYDEEGKPEYTEMSWAHTPQFKTDNGKVWMTINGTDWIEVYAIPSDSDTNYYGKTDVIKDGDVVVGYKVFFPNGEGGYLPDVQVPAYISNPIIHFYSDAERQTEVTSLTGLSQETTLYFTVVGSFGSKPQMFAACEGNWTSSALTYDLSTDGTKYVTGSVKVRPTTAYVGDSTEGKLTLYVPYYGVTGMGQVELSATTSGNVGLNSMARPMQILNKEAGDQTASVTFQLEGEDASSRQGWVLIDNNYTLTNLGTDVVNGNTVDVDMGHGFSSDLSRTGEGGWITLNGGMTLNADGKTFTQNFTLAENTSTDSPRTGAVVVFSPSGREVTRFIIRQDAKTVSMTNLAEKGAANCYVITAPGRYEIPAYEGVQKDLTTASKKTGKPRIVWNDNDGADGNVIRLIQENFSDDRIVFEVTNQTIKNGNALVAITDNTSGNILWSWHLWFCQHNPCNDNATSNTMMDRNLGAKTPATEGLSLVQNYLSLYWKDGLYYQWGRKDPLNLNVTNSENVDYLVYDKLSLGNDKTLAAQNPNTFDTSWDQNDGWNTSKGQQDPCPPGYKVPSSDVWSKKKDDFYRYLNANEYMFAYQIGVTNSVVFTYSGFLDSNGNPGDGIEGGGVLKQGTYKMIEFLGTADYPLYPENQSGLSSEPSTPPRRYDSASYIIRDDNRVGELWASDKSLEYGYEDRGIKITEHKYQEGVWEPYSNLLTGYRTRYRANYNGKSWNPVSSEYNSDGTFNDKLPDNVREKFSDYIKAEYTLENIGPEIKKFLESLGSGGSWFKDGVVYEKKDIVSTNAYTVRCVKE